jgi:hypothetical protein
LIKQFTNILFILLKRIFFYVYFSILFFQLFFVNKNNGDWGLGIGDWGFGDWGLGPIPNPQSPIPNPQSPIPNGL